MDQFNNETAVAICEICKPINSTDIIFFNETKTEICLFCNTNGGGGHDDDDDDDDEYIYNPGVYSPPCICNTNINMVGACNTSTMVVKWFNAEHMREYFCNSIVGQWWEVTDHERWGEQASSCNDGKDMSTDTGCALELGAGVGIESQRIGLYLPWNITITSVAYADDGKAGMRCAGGASSFDLELWTSMEPSMSNFTFVKTIVSGLTSSREVLSELTVTCMDVMFIAIGMRNNCNDYIDDWNVEYTFRIIARTRLKSSHLSSIRILLAVIVISFMPIVLIL